MTQHLAACAPKSRHVSGAAENALISYANHAGKGGKSHPEVSLVVPAYNEESRLERTVLDYTEVLREHCGSFEVVIVANGCTDGTVPLARRLEDGMEEVRLMEISEPVGKGGAVMEGMIGARGDRVVFADADCATAPHSIVGLVAALDHSDVVVGSRRVEGSVIHRRQPLLRRMAGAAFAATVRTFFSMPIRDTQCGAKAFRADAAKNLAFKVEERHWAFDVELLLLAFDVGYRVAEYPVEWTDMDGSRLRYASTVSEVAGSLWNIRRRLVRRAVESSEVVAVEHPGHDLGLEGGDHPVFVETQPKAS